MSLKAKAKKLIRMSPQEIKARLDNTLRIRQARRAYPAELERIQRDDFNFFTAEYRWVLDALRDQAVAPLLAQHGWRRRFPLPLNPLEHPYPADLEKPDRFRRLYRLAYARCLERANFFVQNRFRFLGIDVRFDADIPWQADPVTGRAYPSGFCHDIEIFHNNGKTDIKHVWELNRLQFLIEVAKAWAVSRDLRYKHYIDTVIAHWYSANPYQTGIAWTSALEVAVRAFSLFWVLNFYLVSPEPSAGTVHRILKLLYLSARFIDNNLSIYFSPYNHLIGEVAALFMVGYLFPGFIDAYRWQERAWAILEEQIEKQFHPDGGSVEQATFYHHFTLGFYLQCIAFRRLSGANASAAMMQRIERALEFAMYLTRPDGTIPWIGDNDAARSIYFSDPAHWDFRGFQAIGAAWFRRGDMKTVAGEWHEEAHWLLLESDRKVFEALPPIEPIKTCIALQHSGYTIMRTGWQPSDHFSFIDCGPIAAGLFRDNTPSAAHGHADLLSIEIAPFGEPLLIDPGFSNYRGEYVWHTYFRSTAAHNTLTVDRKSQLEQAGVLNWMYAPGFRVLQQVDLSEVSGFCGEHTGYHRLPGCLTHRRYFLFIARSFWVVFDTLTSQGKDNQRHRIAQHFHLKDGAGAAWKDAGSRLAICGERAKLDIHFLQTTKHQAMTEIRIGGPQPRDGWISPTYRNRQPAPVATRAYEQTTPFSLLAVYVPDLREDSAVQVLERQSQLLRWRVHGRRFEVRIERDRQHPREFSVVIQLTGRNHCIRLNPPETVYRRAARKGQMPSPIEVEGTPQTHASDSLKK